MRKQSLAAVQMIYGTAAKSAAPPQDVHWLRMDSNCRIEETGGNITYEI
ncbi:MAG: hypothetical protein HFH34_00540 [Eubacterium sp.]|nr:hypothetical protein [Eubacterium sp.]